jgi:hypothetical protein
MKHNNFFTIAAATCLLGVYSASIYHFSPSKIYDRQYSELIVMPSPSQDISDVEKIMRAVRVQGPSRVQTNLTVPGAQCAIMLEGLSEDTASPINDKFLQCIGALDVDPAR